MTKKLFYEDPYKTECEAKVVNINGAEVIVDQAVFFAFSGGQASDSGTINDIPVKEAVVSEGDIIYTLEKTPDFKETDKVKIKINWDKRCRIMKLHSAAHIIYFLFAEKTGLKKLIGSNITEEKARLDYQCSQPISEILPEIEGKANEIFSQALEISTYPDKNNPDRRCWEFEEWECHCGGTHVRSTEEIGHVRLKRKNIGAGKERIEITLA